MLDIHTIMPFWMCRAVAPSMREPAKEREEGREVFRKIVKRVVGRSLGRWNAGTGRLTAAEDASNTMEIGRERV